MRGLIRNGLVLLASVVPLTVMAQGGSSPGPPLPLVREIVQGMPRGESQEIRVIVATLKPGDVTPFHTHPFPVTFYVLEGTFTLEMEGHAPVTVRAGQAMVEPPRVRMTGYNRSATEAMRVVLFYVSDPGAPFLDIAHR